MSEQLDKERVITNKKDAIKKLNKLLEYYINDPSGNNLKKANLISYWLKDYVRFLDFESKFDPKRNIAYKRGNVVKINFGFNLGAEYGGLHYGIVLDKNNDHNSPVITVIPLTSTKKGRSMHRNNVDIGNEIYRLLKLKYDAISKQLKEEREEIERTKTDISDLLDIVRDNISVFEQNNHQGVTAKMITDTKSALATALRFQREWQAKEENNLKEDKHLEKIGDEISDMKQGSIALINQITTVSKMRIFDPRNVHGVLSGIALSGENMEKINEKIKDLFIF